MAGRLSPGRTHPDNAKLAAHRREFSKSAAVPAFSAPGWPKPIRDGELVLTDIAPSMLDRCRVRLGGRQAQYQVLDGERPKGLAGIIRSDRLQSGLPMVCRSPGGIERLCALLAPGGRMMFATLGRKTFDEWRHAHQASRPGVRHARISRYEISPCRRGSDLHGWTRNCIRQPYDDGHDFVRTLKALGAGEPASGHRPLSPGAFRRLLGSLESGFTATYHVLYGEMVT